MKPIVVAILLGLTFTSSRGITTTHQIGLEKISRTITTPAAPLELYEFDRQRDYDFVLKLLTANWQWLATDQQIKYSTPKQALNLLIEIRTIIVAYVDQQPVGYCAYYLEKPKVGHISNLVIDAHYRKRGYAQTVLAATIADLAAHGAQEITLHTRPNNTASLRLYEKFGFKNHGKSNEFLLLVYTV